MLIKEFDAWKAQMFDYFDKKVIDKTQNVVLINGSNNYTNLADLRTEIKNRIDNITFFSAYRNALADVSANAVLYNRFKSLLMPLYSYLAISSIQITGAPSVPTNNITTIDKFFAYNTNNTILVDQSVYKKWFDWEEIIDEPKEGKGLLIEDPSFQTWLDSIDLIKLDLDAMTAFEATLSNSGKDKMLYMLFSDQAPTGNIVSPKDYILNDFGFKTLKNNPSPNPFSEWTIPGITNYV